MHAFRISASAVLLAGLVLAGCTDKGAGATKRLPVHKVTGKVTLSGAPVANAMITFSPKGQQPAANGKSDTEGKYTLTTYDGGDGAVAGEYTVMVTKEAPPATPAGGPVGHDATAPKAGVGFDGAAAHNAQRAATGGSNSSSLLPDKYSKTSSPLTVTVKEGANDIPLNLMP